MLPVCWKVAQNIAQMADMEHEPEGNTNPKEDNDHIITIPGQADLLPDCQTKAEAFD